MGIFKKSNKENINQNMYREPMQRKPYDLEFKTLPNNAWQFDYTDYQANSEQFYDTTRLIIQSHQEINGKMVYNCKVSWYGSDDCVYLSKETGAEFGRRAEYRNIRVELDLNRLQTDPNYLTAVMTRLLSQNRVSQYLTESIQGTRECGNYVGGVRLTMRDNRPFYQKYFDPQVGRTVHYMPEMTQKRQNYRDKLEQDRQRSIASKRDQIQKLNREINELEGR